MATRDGGNGWNGTIAMVKDILLIVALAGQTYLVGNWVGTKDQADKGRDDKIAALEHGFKDQGASFSAKLAERDARREVFLSAQNNLMAKVMNNQVEISKVEPLRQDISKMQTDIAVVRAYVEQLKERGSRGK